MQVDHVRNDFVQIPSSTSVQEGGSFSVAEGVNFGFSRTFDDAGPPPGTPVFFFQGILGRSRPEIGRLHRKCGRTQFWCRLTGRGGDQRGLSINEASCWVYLVDKLSPPGAPVPDPDILQYR